MTENCIKTYLDTVYHLSLAGLGCACYRIYEDVRLIPGRQGVKESFYRELNNLVRAVVSGDEEGAARLLDRFRSGLSGAMEAMKYQVSTEQVLSYILGPAGGCFNEKLSGEKGSVRAKGYEGLAADLARWGFEPEESGPRCQRIQKILQNLPLWLREDDFFSTLDEVFSMCGQGKPVTGEAFLRRVECAGFIGSAGESAILGEVYEEAAAAAEELSCASYEDLSKESYDTLKEKAARLARVDKWLLKKLADLINVLRCVLLLRLTASYVRESDEDGRLTAFLLRLTTLMEAGTPENLPVGLSGELSFAEKQESHYREILKRTDASEKSILGEKDPLAEAYAGIRRILEDPVGVSLSEETGGNSGYVQRYEVLKRRLRQNWEGKSTAFVRGAMAMVLSQTAWCMPSCEGLEAIIRKGLDTCEDPSVRHSFILSLGTLLAAEEDGQRMLKKEE